MQVTSADIIEQQAVNADYARRLQTALDHTHAIADVLGDAAPSAAERALRTLRITLGVSLSTTSDLIHFNEGLLTRVLEEESVAPVS